MRFSNNATLKDTAKITHLNLESPNVNFTIKDAGGNP